MKKHVIASLFLVLSTLAGYSKPNVVIFLADDAGWGDFSINGNHQLSTPHIDSIAATGVTLNNFYVSPVCSPTRAEFLTGRYHPRTGVTGVSLGHERMNLDERTIAESFRAAGYATGLFGKWHNGSQWPYHPLARGFDEFLGYSEGHWGEYFDAPLEENGRMIRTEGYIVDVCTDRALKFIEQNKAKPFLCYIPFTTPHSPFAVPTPYWKKFQDKPITQREKESGNEVLDETRCVLAMMENQDWNVGRVLNKLDELKLTENTIVIYFSDNGPNGFRWNGGMKGKKGSTDEGGVRSPFFMKWPARLPAGHKVDQIAGAIDLLPTLTSLAGIQRVGSKPLDGRDLSALLPKEQTREWPDRMIFSSWGNNVSVRTQRYRLDGSGHLFDMLADPGQTNSLNEKAPEIVQSLQTAVKEWRKEMFGSTTPVKGKMARAKVDPRPIPVGYREFPVTILPARDGEPQGSIQRSSSAPNSSYFIHWTDTNSAVHWNISVTSTGAYEVTIDYTCPIPDAGSEIELSFHESRLSSKVEPGWDPPLYANQDTIPRPPVESMMKEFRTINLGRIYLNKGEGMLKLRALSVPGKTVMDLRRVTLTLVDSPR